MGAGGPHLFLQRLLDRYLKTTRTFFLHLGYFLTFFLGLLERFLDGITRQNRLHIEKQLFGQDLKTTFA